MDPRVTKDLIYMVLGTGWETGLGYFDKRFKVTILEWLDGKLQKFHNKYYNIFFHF